MSINLRICSFLTSTLQSFELDFFGESETSSQIGHPPLRKDDRKEMRLKPLVRVLEEEMNIGSHSINFQLRNKMPQPP